MEAYAIISIQTASPALDFQCLVFLTDELKTQLLPQGNACLFHVQGVCHRHAPVFRVMLKP